MKELLSKGVTMDNTQNLLYNPHQSDEIKVAYENLLSLELDQICI